MNFLARYSTNAHTWVILSLFISRRGGKQVTLVVEIFTEFELCRASLPHRET